MEFFFGREQKGIKHLYMYVCEFSMHYAYYNQDFLYKMHLFLLLRCAFMFKLDEVAFIFYWELILDRRILTYIFLKFVLPMNTY